MLVFVFAFLLTTTLKTFFKKSFLFFVQIKLVELFLLLPILF
jgi:hypothetical protein